METELEQNESLLSLFATIATLDRPGDCALFFRDLCTFSELQAMAERWEVVQLVQQGMPYRAISEETGASTATITRIAHWLRHGEGGYRLALARLQKNGRQK